VFGARDLVKVCEGGGGDETVYWAGCFRFIQRRCLLVKARPKSGPILS
jgi:hypothetical protein